MKSLLIVLSLLCVSTCKPRNEGPRPVISNQAEEKLGIKDAEQFRLLDQNSRAHALSDYRQSESLVLMALKKDCFKGEEEKIAKAAAGSKPLLFVAGENSTEFAHVKMPVLFDAWQFLLNRYQLKSAGEFVEVSTSDGEVIGRGAFPSKDCQIKFAGGSHLDFSRDVLPAFSKACVNCHSYLPNLDYFKSMTEIQRWSKMIVKTMELYRMPPGGVDPHLEKLEDAFTPEEMANIYAWAAAGAPSSKGDEAALQAERKKLIASHVPPTWALQKPDLVLKMSEVHKVPAQGPAFYLKAPLAGPMKEDMWVVGLDYSHNLKVLHHSNLVVTYRPFKDISTGMDANGEIMWDQDTDQRQEPLPLKVLAGGKMIGGRLINENTVFSISRLAGIRKFPEGTAAFIPKGSYLSAFNHYQPSGSPERNQSTIKVFKYKGSKTPQKVRRFFVRPRAFTIPKNQSDFVVESTIPVFQDISLVAIATHMHLRGRSAQLTAISSKGERRLLFSMPFYQMKFEKTWFFEKPVIVEKGTLLNLAVTYDNSKNNIANPNSEIDVKTGDNVYTQEMHAMRIMYLEGKL